MRRRPPQSTRTYTLLPSTTLFRSFVVEIPLGGELEGAEGHHLRECLARGRGARRRHGGQVHAARPRRLDLHARGDDLPDLAAVRTAFADGHRARLSGLVEFHTLPLALRLPPPPLVPLPHAAPVSPAERRVG